MTEDDQRSVSRRTVLRSMALAGTVAGTGTAGRAGAARTRPVFPEYVRDARGGAYADLRGESSVTVTVGAGETKFAFEPAFVWVDPGTTVTFEWVSDNHNVVHWSRPAGSDWRGTGPTIYDSGYTHTHAFEVPGMYTYYCQPHDQLRMKGAVAVGPDVPTTDRPFGDEPDTVLGVRLPSTTLQWGVATDATAGATAVATAGAWLWWRSTTVDVDGYDPADPTPTPDTDAERTDGFAGPTPEAGTERGADARDPTPGGGRLERHLRAAVEHRERAEAALTDGEYERAREALDSAETALGRAADVDAGGGSDAGRRVAAEREVVASLRDRCEGR